MSINYENYIAEVLKKAHEDLNQDELTQLLKFNECTTETFLSYDYKSIAESIAKFLANTESDFDYILDRYMNFLYIQYIKSVSQDLDTINYENCIKIIKFIKERGFELDVIERIMAQKLIQTIDIGDIQMFIYNFECLQQIDLDNLMMNNQIFFENVCIQIDSKKNEKYDFVKLVEIIYGLNVKVYSNDLFEKLFLALVLIAYNNQNLLSYLKLSNLYSKYFKTPNDMIRGFRESLISQIFSQIPITPDKPAPIPNKVGQRIINSNSITYSVHLSNFNSLKSEVSLISSFLSILNMKQIESISIEKSHENIQVSLNLNSNLFGLNLYMNPNARLQIESFYYIFSNISHSLLNLASYPIKVCFNLECILIDSENASCLLLPDFCFCSVPKGTDANLDFDDADEHRKYFLYGFANLIEGSLEYLDAASEFVDDLRIVVEKIRKMPEVNLEQVCEYFNSKLDRW